MNNFLKYPGAKWGLASWIICLMPPHHSYLEPYFGSGGVFFNKSQSNIETVNDLNGEVINLFNYIKSDPERLAREIQLTPYARQVYDEAYNPIKDDFQRAVNLLIRCNMGHGFRVTGEKVGWKNDVQGREAAYAVKKWNVCPDSIMCAAERLKQVQIESRPAVDLIKRFNHPNVLIYADPPYLLNTRYGKQYSHEMTEQDHVELLETLLQHKGMVMVSGYESELYNSTLQGWHKEYHKSYTQSMKQKTEVLWMNFKPEGKLF